MTSDEMRKIVDAELAQLFPRGMRGSGQNILRAYYNGMRMNDLAKETPEGSEAVLKRCIEVFYSQKSKN